MTAAQTGCLRSSLTAEGLSFPLSLLNLARGASNTNPPPHFLAPHTSLGERYCFTRPTTSNLVHHLANNIREHPLPTQTGMVKQRPRCVQLVITG